MKRVWRGRVSLLVSLFPFMICGCADKLEPVPNPLSSFYSERLCVELVRPVKKESIALEIERFVKGATSLNEVVQLLKLEGAADLEPIDHGVVTSPTSGRNRLSFELHDRDGNSRWVRTYHIAVSDPEEDGLGISIVKFTSRW